MNYIGATIYTGGIQILGRATHLPWFGGFGIWLTGLGMAIMIGYIVND